MTFRTMTHHRLASIAAMAACTGANVDTASAVTRIDWDHTGTANKLNVPNIEADFCPHAGGAENLTHDQRTTDIAGAKGAKKHTRGQDVKKANCIKVDGIGSASAPAAVAQMAIQAKDEAGVIDFGSASCEGMAPLALVAASAKGTGSMATARRHR